jgi:transitional endoplasmic reticulum ATPase
VATSRRRNPGNGTMEAVAERVLAKASRPPTEQERITAELLEKLDALGGQTVTEDSLVFTGTQFILPQQMEGKIDEVVGFLTEWDQQQNAEFEFVRTFNFKPADGAAAFNRAMKRVFGTTGIGKATFSFFGKQPPQYRSVPAGPGGQTLQVPWGKVNFSLLDATFVLGATRTDEYGIVFQIAVAAPKKHQARIEGFFRVIEDELVNASIYKGRAITAHPEEPQFVDTSGIEPEKIIYRPEVFEQLDVNLWAPMRWTEALRSAGIPLKRAVLLEGPNGTGKTLAGLRTAQIAQENGWTFILVRAGDDPFGALTTARMYAPAVVWVEDLDVIASAGISAVEGRKAIARVLDTLDNVQAKGAEVMAGFTSNFADKLDKSVVRPGRLDAVIPVGDLDADGYERLVRVLVGENLAPDVDFARVAEAYEGFLPAFAAEAAQRAVRYSITRNAGRPTAIRTEDLVDAAFGMKAHLLLMENAKHGDHDVNTMEAKIAEVVSGAINATQGKMMAAEEGYDITFAKKPHANSVQ